MNHKQLTHPTADSSTGDVERLKTALPTIKIEFKLLADEEREAARVKKPRL